MQAVYSIFGYLKQVPKRKLYFGPTKTSISEDKFKSFDWEDFYKDAQESIPLGMSSRCHDARNITAYPII